MKKNFIFAFFIFPSFVASYLGAHQGFPVVQASSAGSGASNSSVSANTSRNWAGYAAASGTFTSVGATWAVPQATSSNSALSADATWVGIGGIASHDLIQAGTQTILENGTSTYEAWYELLPASSVQVPLTVHAGDAMTVSIAEQSSGEWQIYFNDATTGQNYETSVSYGSSLSSAEWIEEMPSDQNGFVPLDNFGTISVTSGFAIENGSRVTIGGAGAGPMTMITNGNQALAAPSSLGSDGASFMVTRSSVVASAPTAIRRGRWSRTGVGVEGYVPQPRAPRRIGDSSFGRFSSFFRNFGGTMRTEFQSLRKLDSRSE